MYTTCLFCNEDLGRNDVLPTFPIGNRLAFDSRHGRLWVICPSCHRWNLSPLDERWEAVEECERRFRESRLRYSTDNIGLSYLPEGLALVRIGPALKPEIAAWRYGRLLGRWLPAIRRDPLLQLARRWRELGEQAADFTFRRVFGLKLGYDVATWLRVHGRADRVLAVSAATDGTVAVIRARHLDHSALVRPDPREPWQIVVHHDGGIATLNGQAGLHVAGKLFAVLNGPGSAESEIRYAIGKLEDAANPEGYFARVAAIAMRCWWGRYPDAPAEAPIEDPAGSEAERLALSITKRSFWGRGGIGSEPRTPLPRLPLVDRLALEMAANEDTERRALEGELAVLESAWRQAEEIAAISDGMFRSNSYELCAMSYGTVASQPIAHSP
ncbi:MAG TPA: hypothetical protein VGQ69_01480 [Gemmatimonadales bacterium]|jgi:hypothetical protein|nr:hypothetical protein [Gemmatimonadales bacterium]